MGQKREWGKRTEWGNEDEKKYKSAGEGIYFAGEAEKGRIGV